MKFKGIEKRLREVMYLVHAEARTGYLNPNIDAREQGNYLGKYITQEQYEGVFTIPGEKILNLHQHSWISLLA